MTQPLSGEHVTSVENELDIRGPFRTSWTRKVWIVGIAPVFASATLVYMFSACQGWNATAIPDRPTVSMLGDYYSQQQPSHNLDIKASLTPAGQPSVMNEAYKKFVMQLAS